MRASRTYFLIFFALLLTPWFAQATLTITSVTGVTSWSDTYTDSTTGVTNKPTIVGGMIGRGTGTVPCSTDDSTTCDSCANGTSSSLFCNRAETYKTLNVVVTLTSSATLAAGTSAFIFLNSSSPITSGYTATVSGSVVTFTIPWSQLCNIAVSGNTSCATSFSNTAITFAVDTAGGTNATDSLAFNVTSSYVDSTSAAGEYTSCPTGAESPSGICYAEIVRGDEKVYLNNVTQGSSYPNPPTGGGANFGGIVVFYAQTSSLSDVTINSSSTEFTANTSATPATFSDNRITGLTNDTEYCFKIANKDLGGNIYLMTPAASATSQYCATPSKVVGLLDDKHCFIATAAFGSQMAPEVDTFRHFRNQFLLNHGWGRSFVRTYYKYSPPVANFISQSETLRAMARAGLWPLLVFAKISLQFGVWAALLMMAALILVLRQVWRRVVKA